jgi:hypothetical protein
LVKHLVKLNLVDPVLGPTLGQHQNWLIFKGY